MTDRIHTQEKLEKLLRKHFPNSSSSKIKKHAEKTYNRWDTARALERIERNNVRPKRDIENLEQAAKHLRRAAAKLSEVGIHGGAELVSAAVDYKKIDMPKLPPDQKPGVSKTEAANVVRAQIDLIAEALSIAAGKVNTNESSFLDWFGEDYKTGSRKKTSAFFTTKRCHKTYAKLSKTRPARITEFVGNDRTEPAGPFFDFVSEVFEILDIEANVEHQIKAVFDEIRNHMEKTIK